jgi:hypothetical protein
MTRQRRISMTPANSEIVAESWRQLGAGQVPSDEARAAAKRVLDGAARRKLDGHAVKPAPTSDADTPAR